MGVRVRDGEKHGTWEPTEPPVDLGVLGMSGLVEEYDRLEERIRRDAARRDEIKEAMKGLGKNRVITVNGHDRFQLRNDGQFMKAQFRKEFPGYYEDFLRPATVREFDLEAFKQAMPGLYGQYRAAKIVRVN